MKGRRGRYGTNQELDYEDEYSAETGLLQLFDYYSYFIVDQRSPAYTQLSGGSTERRRKVHSKCAEYIGQYRRGTEKYYGDGNLHQYQ